MLNKKVTHKKLRPKPVKDSKYLSWLHCQNLGCFICGEHNQIELHHIKECSSDSKDDTKVIGLCGESCHRNGTELSAHGTPKKFREKYPIEYQLKYAEKLRGYYLKEMLF